MNHCYRLREAFCATNQASHSLSLNAKLQKQFYIMIHILYSA